MAARNRLKQISIELDEPLDKLIPRMITEEGSILRAAIRLGVAPNTIQWWLRSNGYSVEQRSIVVKEPVNAS